MDPSQREKFCTPVGGVVVVSKFTAVIIKKAVKLSRSCHINQPCCSIKEV